MSSTGYVAHSENRDQGPVFYLGGSSLIREISETVNGSVVIITQHYGVVDLVVILVSCTKTTIICIAQNTELSNY
jgi:hypothetical protein